MMWAANMDRLIKDGDEKRELAAAFERVFGFKPDYISSNNNFGYRRIGDVWFRTYGGVLYKYDSWGDVPVSRPSDIL